ncbi:MAG: UDP-N-acetylmuramoyl-L-alanyl-D-glutamate--2,6-diaminopimelate ligase [Gammaproteobacteria bacterium]|nr:UDP-N-acetylmuramoyl-L-alanyl-D-glutamate--2,6-diaminopimelate ligase [Gammaproteobacteria bacterium]
MAAERSPPTRCLAELLAGAAEVPAALDVAVTGLALDSREVAPGDAFFARRGRSTDGAHFADDAVRRGAVAVVRAGPAGGRRRADGVVEIGVADVARAVGLAAHRFYGEPSARLRVVGVTGTNGKSTVAHFLAQCLGAGEHGDARPCGVLGTLGHGIYPHLEASRLTTPDAITVHRWLAEIAATGARDTVMEVSSHALDQGRVAGVAFAGAVFTNLTRDHLDYHADMEAYGETKRQLFATENLGFAAVNGDDPFGVRLARDIDGARAQRPRLLVYGMDDAAGDLPSRAERVRGRLGALDEHGLRLEVAAGGARGDLSVPLLGRFNAYNLLAALAALLAMDWALPAALARLATVRPPAGRMERFGGARDPLIVVDYSHTPDSLLRALESLRAQCAGKLWCVFGAGGERDPGKRPAMGAAAAAHADEIVLTDDNPRGEDGDTIIAGIREGIPDERRVVVERDRARAIAMTVAAAATSDVVLVAGKGHESYQEVRGVRHPFSDADTVRAALEARHR